VTFLFTDIEGSTRRWLADPTAMEKDLERHDQTLRDVVAVHDGRVFKHTGDGTCSVFASARHAVQAAIAAQRLLDLPVRMGVHTGDAQLREGDYFGPTLNRAARVMDAGHGGQILVSAATAPLVGDVTLVDLGEHSLRDLASSERLSQVVADGLRQEFPPARSMNSYRSNLPAQRSSFIGRDDELAAVRRALDSNRVVTLTGVGGVGKTRLALQAGAAVLPQFTDGVWFCELAMVNDLDAVADVVAAAMNIRQRQGDSMLQSIVDALRAQDALVLLDNCEHKLDDIAELVDLITARASNVRILATSREGLGVEGERILAVPSLEVADGDTSTAPIEAVELFVDRAAALVDGFVLDDTNRAAAVEVCRRLDGIPLAIELAAARVAAMTPTKIAAHLDERFRLLTGGRRRSRERHQTLRRTIDWSYDLLDDRSKWVMRRLAVFGGTFDLAAAETVAAGPMLRRGEALDVVSELVAKSLLTAEAVAAQTRYRFLETIRQYGEERLEESGELDAANRAAAGYFVEWSATAVEHVLGPDEFAWATRLRQELPNLRCAVDWSLDTGEADWALSILAPFHRGINGDASTVRSLATGVIDTLGIGDQPLTPAVLTVAAEDLRARHLYDQALEWLGRAIEMSVRTAGVPLASTLNLLGQLLGTVGRFSEGFDRAAEGAELARAAGDALGEVNNLVGMVFWGQRSDRLGQDELQVLAARAWDLAARSGYPNNLGNARLALGLVVLAESR
jgi:predicted ATPase